MLIILIDTLSSVLLLAGPPVEDHVTVNMSFGIQGIETLVYSSILRFTGGVRINVELTESVQ